MNEAASTLRHRAASKTKLKGRGATPEEDFSKHEASVPLGPVRGAGFEVPTTARARVEHLDIIRGKE